MSLRERIWDTLTIHGLGGLLKPWQIGRTGIADARVQRKKMLIEAQTEMDIMKVKSGEVTINDKGEMVANENENLIQVMLDDEKMNILRKKTNLLKTLDKTFLMLEDNTENCDETSEKPSEEWFERWREYSEKANIEEMQILWAKILNQEIRYGGSISLRTMDFLRSISRKEAILIEKICKMAFQNILIYNVDNKKYTLPNNDTILVEKGINYNILLVLEYLGVISGIDSMGVIFEWKTISNDSFLFIIKIGENTIKIANENPKMIIYVCAYQFSILGMELMKILNLEKDMEYFGIIFNKLRSLGFKVEIE
jgi:hypothetical protein